MTTETMQANDLEMLRVIALQGSRRSAEVLGQFSGNALTVPDANAFIARVEEVPTLFGDPQEVVVGLDFSFSGDMDGYMIACLTLPDAARLIEYLLGTEVRDFVRLQELELSALGETGNLLVSSFLASLEGSCGVLVTPSPPAVAVEMAGAILTSAILPLAEVQDEVIVIEAQIVSQDPGATHAVSCRLQFLPTASAWRTLRESFARKRA